MKYQMLFAFFLLLSFSVVSQVVITGNVFGKKVTTLKIFTPIYGFYNLNNEASCINVQLDSNQSFNQKINLTKECGFITIKISNRNIYLIVEKNDTINIVMDLIKLQNNDNWLQFRGHNSIGHLLFNHYFSSPILNFKAIYDYNASFSISKSINPISFIESEINKKSNLEWYWLANDKSKAINAAQKAIETLK